MSEYTVPFRPGLVVWLTGLPSSGKSTLAACTCEKLRATGSAALLLDEEDLRAALRPELGCDEEGHDAFHETLARLAALAAAQGFIVLVAATAHRRAFRDRARALSQVFLEVFVDTPLEECMRRDSKGLYERARTEGRGVLHGMHAGYEVPMAPELVLGSDERDASDKLTTYILHLLPRR
jgi:adenylylsulfate kinase